MIRRPCPEIGPTRQQRERLITIGKEGMRDWLLEGANQLKAPEGSVGNHFEPLKLRGGWLQPIRLLRLPEACTQDRCKLPVLRFIGSKTHHQSLTLQGTCSLFFRTIYLRKKLLQRAFQLRHLPLIM